MANRVKAHLLNAQTFPARIKTAQLRDREMGKLLLPNGIKVVLISDKTTPTAGAAMSIEAGSWLDGKHQGTAHFLEHMLFLGTKKYPDESDYERYMFDSNGTLNGYTANDHSMYYFSSILPSALPGALDRFSRFFYEPMLAKSCINREMNAVDEEYRKNLESDAWRFLHVQKDLANAHHPFSGFNTGNLDTMRLIDHSYLSSWFVRNYVADKMNLVVHGKESIEELTDQVYKHFSPIKRSQNVGDFNDLGDVFPKSMKKKVVWVDPIKNVKQLSLHWEIPERFMSLKTKPANIVSSIIGNEGHNSLLSELKKKGYVETLSAGASELGYSNNMFEISVSLTDNGLKCWQSVVEQIFAGLRSLEREQVSSYVVDEINAMSKTHYEYQQRSSSIATNYCQALRKEPLDSFPFHSYFIETFSRELIGDVFRHLSPENAFVMILAKNDAVKYESQEKWMGAAYCTKSWLPSSVILPDNVKLPAPNQFISKKLELLDIKTSQVPEMIHSSEGVTLYHFPDNSFESPEAAIHFFIKTPSISPGNAKSLALSMVWNKFVADRLTEYSYNSSIAGLNYRVHTSKNSGIALSLDGYNQGTLKLLTAILDVLKTPLLEQNLFDVIKTSLLNNLLNAAKNDPVRQAVERFSCLVHDRTCSSAELAEAMRTTDIEQLKEFSLGLFKRRIIDGFVGGNVTRDSAIEAWHLLSEALPGLPCPTSHVEAAKLQFPISGTGQPQLDILNPNVAGNAMFWNVLVGKRNFENRVGCELLSKLMKEPFYSELRTKQQTGYIVSSGMSQVDKHMFLNAAIQSNSYDARDLLARTELFMQTFQRNIMESVSMEARFGTHFLILDSIKQATIDRLRQPFDRLSTKQEFYNRLIYDEDCNFNLIDERIQSMSDFQFSDMQKFSEEVLLNSYSKRLAVLANGNDEGNKLMSYTNLEYS